jgi:hypothetical protein
MLELRDGWPGLRRLSRLSPGHPSSALSIDARSTGGADSDGGFAPGHGSASPDRTATRRPMPEDDRRNRAAASTRRRSRSTNRRADASPSRSDARWSRLHQCAAECVFDRRCAIALVLEGPWTTCAALAGCVSWSAIVLLANSVPMRNLHKTCRGSHSIRHCGTIRSSARRVQAASRGPERAA